MARGGVEIFDDDEESDIAAYMLEACGLESKDFYANERVFTRENFEKNLDVLVKMAKVRRPKNPQEVYEFNRAPYFVIGYFALLTGARISETPRKDISEATKWEDETGWWRDESFALKRKIYI